jgi:hypothetical protein
MRITKFAFVAVMSVLLALPAAQMIHPFVDIPSLSENRTLTPFPDLMGVIRHEHARLAPRINKWFDDHMGFRPLLTRISNQIDYSVFGVSQNVVVGQKGWFYQPSWLFDQVYQERGGDRLQQQARTKIVKLATYLAKRNIKLVVVSVPLSSTLYPEFLPAGAPRIPRPSQFDKFTEFLKGRQDLLYVDGLDALTPHKSMGVFFTTDHHYNQCGGYFIARALIRTVAASEGRDDPWDRDVHFTTYPGFSGAFVRFLSTFVTPQETFCGLEQESSVDYKNLPAGQSLVEATPPFEYVYRNDDSRKDKLPPTVFFGSSFLDWLPTVGVLEYFSRIYRFRSDGAGIDRALDAMPADTRYFVLLFIQPYFRNLTKLEVPGD